MRKLLKTKQQGDNNMHIFKQAKRRFHYQPTHKEQKYFLHSKHKQTNHQFKDDFSSVKQFKNQNNQINQSSWIVKLVNVMHQNSSEDLKNTHSSPQNILSIHPLQSKEIQIIDHPKQPQKKLNPQVINEAKDGSPLATKKNSVNVQMKKKRSRSQKSESCDTVSKKGKNHSKVQTIKRFRNEVNIKKNHSQSLIKSKQQKQNIKVESSQSVYTKSMKNISTSKIVTERIHIDSNIHQSQIHTHLSKHFSNLGLDSKQSSQVTKQVQQNSRDKLKLSNQEIKKEDEIININKQHNRSIHVDENKQNIDSFLKDQDQNLFSNSTNQKPSIKTQSMPTTQKRSHIGSIKKNRPPQIANHHKNSVSKQQQIKMPQVLVKKEELLSIPQVNEQQDVVTARQEQVLIQKYLNNDYSFKKQSGIFKYDYSINQFEKPISQYSKPSLIYEKGVNSGKNTIRNDGDRLERDRLERGDRFERSYMGISERCENRLQQKRDSYKKFSYFSDKPQKQTTQNSMSLQILTLRCNQQTPRLQQINEEGLAKSIKYEQRQKKQLKSSTEQDLKRIHQKYNYHANRYNKQNEVKIDMKKYPIREMQYRLDNNKKSQLSVVSTKRESYHQSKTFINRTPYLRQSTYKVQDSPVQREQNIVHHQYAPPFRIQSQMSKPQYRSVNSGIDNLNSISRRQLTESDMCSEAQSDQLISKLNNKLNKYINHYGLQKGCEQIVQNKQFEPTHRKINLNFNQLKKHHDIFH